MAELAQAFEDFLETLYFIDGQEKEKSQREYEYNLALRSIDTIDVAAAEKIYALHEANESFSQDLQAAEAKHKSAASIIAKYLKATKNRGIEYYNPNSSWPKKIKVALNQNDEVMFM